jgi:hypothetical protein
LGALLTASFTATSSSLPRDTRNNAKYQSKLPSKLLKPIEFQSNEMD